MNVVLLSPVMNHPGLAAAAVTFRRGVLSRVSQGGLRDDLVCQAQGGCHQLSLWQIPASSDNRGLHRVVV